jgi:hypothetical protein
MSMNIELLEAIKKGSPTRLLEIMETCDIDPNDDVEGRKPIVVAAEIGHYTIVEILLEFSAEINGMTQVCHVNKGTIHRCPYGA